MRLKRILLSQHHNRSLSENKRERKVFLFGSFFTKTKNTHKTKQVLSKTIKNVLEMLVFII